MKIGISLMSKDIIDQKIRNQDVFYEIADFCMPDTIPDCEKITKDVCLYISKGRLQSIQGPVRDIKPEAMDKDIRQITVKRFQQLIDVASKYEIPYVLFFTTFDCLVKLDSYKKMWLENNIAFWKEVVAYAEKRNVICLYCNVWDDTPYLLKNLFDAVNSKYFRFSFDLGHAFYISKTPLTEWIDCLKDYISYVPIHDNNGQKDEHLAIGRGIIPIKETIDYIEAKCKNVKYCIQLFDNTELVNSIHLLQEFLS